MKNCIDCQKDINIRSTRCKSCNSRLRMLGTKGALSPAWKGGLFTPKCVDCGKQITHPHKRCNPCMGLSYRGANHYDWKGGTSTLRNAEMRKREYFEWRTAVFKRDNYTCQICDERGGRLEADHKVPWAISKDKRYSVSNGITMCKSCHATKTYLIDFKILKGGAKFQHF